MLACNIVNEHNHICEDLERTIHTFNPKYIVYHDKCSDGITSAWIAWKFYGMKPILIGTYPGNFPHEIEEDEDRDVNILYVDLSPDRDKYPDITSRNVIIIDHHKSCYEQYSKYPGLVYGGDENTWSAAMMCQHIFGTNYKWVEYVSDRDTWRFELDHSFSINTAIHIKDLLSDPKSINYNLTALGELDCLKQAGSYYLDVEDKYVRQIAERVYIKEIDSKNVGFVNCPILQSDVGNYLVENDIVDTAIMYTANNILDKDFIRCSVRSADGSAGPFAKQFGGGGHDNAAGFSTTISYLRKKLNPTEVNKRKHNPSRLPTCFDFIDKHVVMMIIIIVGCVILYCK